MDPVTCFCDSHLITGTLYVIAIARFRSWDKNQGTIDMRTKEKKATSKTPKRPRDSPDSQSDDDLKHGVLQRPGTIRGFCERLHLPQGTVWLISWQVVHKGNSGSGSLLQIAGCFQLWKWVFLCIPKWFVDFRFPLDLLTPGLLA